MKNNIIIERNSYLNKLINRIGNGRIKIITGLRRCGKSFLLFNIFKQYLLNNNVKEEQIIEIKFDDWKNRELRNPQNCYDFITQKIKTDNKYYILLDEVQMMKNFEDVLSGFLHIENADTFVTGSNSKFLSTDIITEFRGRGDEIRLYPLSISEIAQIQTFDWDELWQQYYTFGGLPYIQKLENDEEKTHYLQTLFKETYLQDIIERNKIKNLKELDTLIDILASSIGSLTNAQKLSNTFKSKQGQDISAPTIKKYFEYLEESFLIKEVKRYDIRGKHYINTPVKYYFEDIGLRNAKLNFRQQEQTHIMENIIFNELRYRGYSIDIGIIEAREKSSDINKKQYEIDFIANSGAKKYYIQSAYSIPNQEKLEQEKRVFKLTKDFFKKIIIVHDNIKTNIDEHGIVFMNIKDFLLNPDSLDF